MLTYVYIIEMNWTCEWLYFFEFWCITGKWCGGGKHPTKKDIKENDKF